MPAALNDPVISVLALLKAQWSETAPAAANIKFKTAPVVEQFKELAGGAYVCVYRPKAAPEARWVRNPWRVIKLPLTIGFPTHYLEIHPVRIDIVLKPDSASGFTIKDAKKYKWNMLEEIQRIIINFSRSATDVGGIEVDSVFEDDDYTTRNILSTAAIIIRCVRYI